MAAVNGDLYFFSTGAITADSAILPLDTQAASAGDRLVCLQVAFNAVNAPKYPFDFDIHDSSDASGPIIFSWRGAENAGAATGKAGGPFTLIGDYGVFSGLGSGYTMRSGALYCNLTQGGSGTNDVSITISGIISKKV